MTVRHLFIVMWCVDISDVLQRFSHWFGQNSSQFKKLSIWKIIRACRHCNFQIGGQQNSLLPIAFYIFVNKIKTGIFKSVQPLCDSSLAEDIGKYQEILKAAELGQCWAPLKISIKSVAQPLHSQRTLAPNFKADVLSILCGFFYCLERVAWRNDCWSGKKSVEYLCTFSATRFPLFISLLAEK